jgi:hypothetical protein
MLILELLVHEVFGDFLRALFRRCFCHPHISIPLDIFVQILADASQRGQRRRRLIKAGRETGPGFFVDSKRTFSERFAMSTPGPLEPPTSETIEAYRTAVSAYRRSWKAEREKWGSMKMNPRIPERAAAQAVHRLRPELTYEQACALAQQATNWAAQVHWEWFWKGVSTIAD